jgi:hypothetical protein
MRDSMTMTATMMFYAEEREMVADDVNRRFVQFRLPISAARANLTNVLNVRHKIRFYS